MNVDDLQSPRWEENPFGATVARAEAALPKASSAIGLPPQQRDMKSPQGKKLRLKMRSPTEQFEKGAGYREYLKGGFSRDSGTKDKHILESSGLNGMGGLGLGSRATPADNMS